MKFKNVQKCYIVGYLFLVMTTLVEIILFYNLFNIHTIEKFMIVSATVFLFNFAIWFVALKYQTIKEHFKGDN